MTISLSFPRSAAKWGTSMMTGLKKKIIIVPLKKHYCYLGEFVAL
jgi:hypothetical protein